MDEYMSETPIEKLVLLNKDGVNLYVQPSKVVAIKDRLMGCDIYIGDGTGKGIVKIFVILKASEVAQKLGLV